MHVLWERSGGGRCEVLGCLVVLCVTDVATFVLLCGLVEIVVWWDGGFFFKQKTADGVWSFGGRGCLAFPMGAILYFYVYLHTK